MNVLQTLNSAGVTKMQHLSRDGILSIRNFHAAAEHFLGAWPICLAN